MVFDRFSGRIEAAVGRVRPELPSRKGRSPDLVQSAMDLVKGRLFRGERVRERREGSERKREKYLVLVSGF